MGIGCDGASERTMTQPDVSVIIGAYEAMPYLVALPGVGRGADASAPTASRSSPSTTVRRTARGSTWRSSPPARACPIAGGPAGQLRRPQRPAQRRPRPGARALRLLPRRRRLPRRRGPGADGRDGRPRRHGRGARQGRGRQPRRRRSRCGRKTRRAHRRLLLQHQVHAERAEALPPRAAPSATSMRFDEALRTGEDALFTMEAYLRADGVSVVADYTCYYLVGRDDGKHVTKSGELRAALRLGARPDEADRGACARRGPAGPADGPALRDLAAARSSGPDRAEAAGGSGARKDRRWPHR